MFELILFEPEIPPNTGNIIRVCANTGTTLHLIHPLGFNIDDKSLRRAGLDYQEFAEIREHQNLISCLEFLGKRRIFPVSTRGKRLYSSVSFKRSDAFLLGPETRGLPESIINNYPPEDRIRIPMQPNSRSLNLSNAAALIVYEAWRQLEFQGGK